jgi:alkanesulfonate monooxygenase SsuD/methylene tetrahydromethanopterin reductase-like flavin-dependent oxidoreductase (luciferase family)
VGLGWALEEFRVFDADAAKRVGVVRETLEILRLAWSEDVFDYRGEHFELRDVRVRPKPVQKPHPPIWGGASTAQGARRVARWRLPLLWVEPAVSQAYMDAWRGAGFPTGEARIDGYVNLFVCDDPEAVWPEIRRNFLYQALRPDIKSKRAGPGGSVVERAALTLDDIEDRRRGGDILVVTPGQAVDAAPARRQPPRQRLLLPQPDLRHVRRAQRSTRGAVGARGRARPRSAGPPGRLTVGRAGLASP